MEAKPICALLGLLLLGTAEAADTEYYTQKGGNCFPNCHWICNEPACPAKCSPKCMKPKCEHMCKPLGDSQCSIRCEVPECEVRCVKKKCADGRCPVCENVCLPAKCQTVCTPPKPECKPQCTRPSCQWLCKKPLNCPKPKCMLKCENPNSPEALAKGKGCPNAAMGPGGSKCCPCSSVDNISMAIELATERHNTSSAIQDVELPTLIEVHDQYHYYNKPHHGKKGKRHYLECCPCGENHVRRMHHNGHAS
ncbi:hypothetical protein AAMO2058_000157600 [Amorphochlora amoebiformis]